MLRVNFNKVINDNNNNNDEAVEIFKKILFD